MNQSKRPTNKKIVGKTFESNNCGSFVVVAKAGRNKWGKQLYHVRFVATGHEVEALKQVIKDGRLKDPYSPSVASVGYLGAATTREDGVKKPSYQSWADMLNRCYNPDDKAYDNYGGRGIRVCERWLNFERYEDDLALLDGYDDPERDTVDRVDNNGGYSPDNCRYASMTTQAGNRRNMRDFIAITPGTTGGFYFGSNQAQFAREHGLDQGGISGCLRGQRKTHKGWRFEFVDAEQ